MSKKQSIFGRIAQLAKANTHAAIDAAEDPSLMLDQTVREYTDNIREAETAVATTIGNLRMLEEDQKGDTEDAEEWGRKALAASQRAEKFRAAGDDTSAEKFNQLAKVALQKQLTEEREAASKATMIESQRMIVDKLKTGLEAMKHKRTELSSKRDELVARNRNAIAQGKMLDAVKSIDIMDPSSEVGRFEEKIRREEARVIGAAELSASSLDAQFEDLEDLGEMAEVEARLASMKGPQASLEA